MSVVNLNKLYKYRFGIMLTNCGFFFTGKIMGNVWEKYGFFLRFSHNFSQCWPFADHSFSQSTNHSRQFLSLHLKMIMNELTQTTNNSFSHNLLLFNFLRIFKEKYFGTSERLSHCDNGLMMFWFVYNILWEFRWFSHSHLLVHKNILQWLSMEMFTVSWTVWRLCLYCSCWWGYFIKIHKLLHISATLNGVVSQYRQFCHFIISIHYRWVYKKKMKLAQIH